MNPIATLVMYSDLLGFGNLVSSANGTFASPVGKVALERIESLRNSIFNNEIHFPINTKFYQLNDLVVANMDVNLVVSSMTIDPSSTSSQPASAAVIMDVLKFMSAAAKFHQDILNSDNQNQAGQGCRTFLVLGQRWTVSSKPSTSNVMDTFELQANMALAEAYSADSQGSGAGFQGGPWDRFYVNDYLWHTLVDASAPLARQLAQIPLATLQRLDGFGVPNRGLLFPDNLSREPTIKIKIFHRTREFHSLMSHWACKI